MEITFLKAFDRLIPDSMKWDVKEVLRSFEYYRYNMFKNGYEVFSRVDVETNTDCNRTCRICPCYYSSRPCGHMSLDLYENLLRQLAEMKFKGRLSPVFYNEPMLDARLPNLMRKARIALPKVQLTIYTNGSLLTSENLKTLVDSGLDGIIVSQYEDYLSQDNIDNLLNQLPHRMMKKIRYRVLRDDQPLSTRGGLVKVKRPIKKKFCFQASTDTIIDYEGNVLLCCNDYFGEHSFGNIGEKNILEIWNQPEFKKLRKQLRKGDFKEKMCRACSQGALLSDFESTN